MEAGGAFPTKRVGETSDKNQLSIISAEGQRLQCQCARTVIRIVEASKRRSAVASNGRGPAQTQCGHGKRIEPEAKMVQPATTVTESETTMNTKRRYECGRDAATTSGWLGHWRWAGHDRSSRWGAWTMRLSTRSAFVAVLVLGAAGCGGGGSSTPATPPAGLTPTQSSAAPTVLTAVVVDVTDESGAPVVGAQVSAFGLRQATDARGIAEFAPREVAVTQRWASVSPPSDDFYEAHQIGRAHV
jgi:hypothetical protein